MITLWLEVVVVALVAPVNHTDILEVVGARVDLELDHRWRLLLERHIP